MRLPVPGGGDDADADLATLCQDGCVRVYTRDPVRRADDEQISQLEDAVSKARVKSSTGPTPDEIAKLPKWEMNALHRGRSEGQVQVFNKEGRAIAAQWSETSGTWIEVGEVTGTNQNAGEVDGVKYDHVFPIEIDVPGGEVRELRIGYNTGENPFVTAQKFIDDHMLEQNYLPQIADYIRQRAGDSGPTLGMAGGAESGSAQMSSSGGAGSGSGSGSTDTVPMDISPPAPTYRHLPMRGYKAFESGAETKVLFKIMSKIREFNASLTTNLSTPELSALDGLCSTLASTSRYHATLVSDLELSALAKIIQCWDADRVFPALDLCRLTVLHPDASRSDREGIWSDVTGWVLDKCRGARDAMENGVGGNKAREVAVPMLGLRVLANMFRGGTGSRSAVSSRISDVIGCAESFALSGNKNVRLSVSTVVLDAAVYLSSTTLSPDTASEAAGAVVSAVGAIVGSGLYDSESTVRSLVALGTALLAGGEETRKVARNMHVQSMAQHAAAVHGDKAIEVAEEIRLILA